MAFFSLYKRCLTGLETKCMIGKQSVFFHNMILQCQLQPKELTIISWIEGQFVIFTGRAGKWSRIGQQQPKSKANWQVWRWNERILPLGSFTLKSMFCNLYILILNNANGRYTQRSRHCQDLNIKLIWNINPKGHFVCTHVKLNLLAMACTLTKKS